MPTRKLSKRTRVKKHTKKHVKKPIRKHVSKSPEKRITKNKKKQIKNNFRKQKSKKVVYRGGTSTQPQNDNNISAVQQEISKLRRIVNSNNINSLNDKSKTPLYLAIDDNNTEMVRFLVENGADVNAKDVGGSTALHRAAINSVTSVELLLENGADVNATDNNNMTPLFNAVLQNFDNSSWGNVLKIAIMKKLIEYGADVNVEVENIGSVLQLAIIIKNVDSVSVLIAAGAGATEENKETAQYIWDNTSYGAPKWGDMKVITNLLKVANVLRETQVNEPVLHYLLKHQNVDKIGLYSQEQENLVKSLIKNSSDDKAAIDILLGDEDNIFTAYVRKDKKLQLIYELIDAGVNVNTVIIKAYEAGKFEIVTTLFKNEEYNDNINSTLKPFFKTVENARASFKGTTAEWNSLTTELVNDWNDNAKTKLVNKFFNDIKEGNYKEVFDTMEYAPSYLTENVASEEVLPGMGVIALVWNTALEYIIKHYITSSISTHEKNKIAMTFYALFSKTLYKTKLKKMLNSTMPYIFTSRPKKPPFATSVEELVSQLTEYNIRKNLPNDVTLDIITNGANGILSNKS